MVFRFKSVSRRPVTASNSKWIMERAAGWLVILSTVVSRA